MFNSESKNKLLDLLKQNRSYRRFDARVSIPLEEIISWIEALRYTASVKNAQPLKYRIVIDPVQVEAIFDLVHWAAYLTDWAGPSPEERPTAFVIQVLDRTISSSSRFDEGIQLEAFTLMASEAGYGACILGAFDQKKLATLLELDPEHYIPNTVVAIGKPIETICIENLSEDRGRDIRYYRTPDKVHHVPKRGINELII